MREMLNMFSFPAMLLAIFNYFEGEIDYNLAKTLKILKTCVNLHYRLIFVQLNPYQGVTSHLEWHREG